MLLLLPTPLLLATFCLLVGTSGTASGSPTTSLSSVGQRGALHGASEQPPPRTLGATRITGTHRSSRLLPLSGGPRAEDAPPASRPPPPPPGSARLSSRGRSNKPKLVLFELEDDEDDQEDATPIPARSPPPVVATEKPPRVKPEPPRPPKTPIVIETVDDPDDDGDDVDGGATGDGKKAPLVPPRRGDAICDYDPCRHGQKPCHVLQQETGCRCAGVVENKKPQAPRLRKVDFADDLTVEVQWCAPESQVLDYYLRYHEEGDVRDHRTHQIHPTWRRFTLRDLVPSSRYNVCVVAVNAVGESECVRVPFEMPRAYREVVMACALAAFFALLVVIAVLAACLCRRRYREKNRVLITRYNSEDLVSAQNPVFTDDFAKVDQVVHLDFSTYGKA
ncbi:uncharacterized protein LOC144937081 [Lampetra fluviatilis]